MRYTFAVNSIVGGVSQQPDAVRLPSQCSELINGIPSVVEGLKKRAPSEWLATPDGTGLAPNEGRLWAVKRDKDEQYLVLFSDGKLRVFGLNGTEYGIFADETWGTPDWSYLTNTEPADVKLLNVADYTFILNTTRRVTEASTLVDQQDTIKGHAYVSVVQGAYSTDYQINLDPLDAFGGNPPEAYITRTWDGESVANETKSKYRVQFKDGAVGSAGDTWAIDYTDYQGVTQTITKQVPIPASAAGLAELFREAFGAATEIKVSGLKLSSGGHWWYFTIEAQKVLETAPGSGPWDLAPANNTVPAGATPALFPELQEPQVAELDKIQTREIALDLAAKINASSTLFTAEAFEHVVKITGPLDFGLDVSDSSNGTLMLPCNRQVNEYAELPTRCTDGYGVKVRGSTKGPEDDYWVRFSIETSTGSDLTGFGAGLWEEGLPLYPQGTIQGADGFQRSFLQENMPWQLVRRFTQPQGAVYFTWEKPDWSNREVGDLEMNPFPGFVGEKLQDIVFHRNRLGLVAGSKIVFSEAGAYFNFWRTTVRQLLDSDPVDLESNLRDVIDFRHAVEVDGDLILFSDKAVVRLEAEPLLTPTTGALRPALRLAVDTARAPEVIGRTILVPTSRGGYSGFQEVYRLDEANYGYYDITEQVPFYINGQVKEITACPQEGRVVVLTTTGELYLHCYFYSGNEKLQSSWSKLALADGNVLGIAFLDTDLYLLVHRDGSYDLERMSFAAGLADEDHETQCYLDRRLDASIVATYLPSEDRTRLALPFYAYPDSEFTVVNRNTWAPIAIVESDLSTPGAQVLYLAGDQTSTPMWVGLEYPMTWTLSKVLPREGTQSGAQRGILSGRAVVQYGTFALKESGAARVTVSSPWGQEDVYWWFGPNLGTNSLLASTSYVGDEVFQFPVKARSDEATITVESGSFLPLAITGVEWELDYFTRSPRARA